MNGWSSWAVIRHNQPFSRLSKSVGRWLQAGKQCALSIIIISFVVVDDGRLSDTRPTQHFRFQFFFIIFIVPVAIVSCWYFFLLSQRNRHKVFFKNVITFYYCLYVCFASVKETRYSFKILQIGFVGFIDKWWFWVTKLSMKCILLCTDSKGKVITKVSNYPAILSLKRLKSPHCVWLDPE